MNIEQELFKKSIINPSKLITYGFTKSNKEYHISKNILNNSFRIDITITLPNTIKGHIYDLDFNEEYTNFRVTNQVGEFVSKIREEFTNFLLDIKNNCTDSTYFITPQANRITSLIIKEFNVYPEFPWEDDTSGIFRNPTSQKWYGLIMYIDKNKLTKEHKMIEVLNLKLDEEEIKQLLKRKGFYKAYHMNKTKWITITLDDTLEDEEIMTYIKESHSYTVKTKEWLIPANPSYYDIINAFNNTDTIKWKQSNNINIGDIVYLYVTKPYQSIMYKCSVTKINIPYKYEDYNLKMNKVMEIKLLNKYNPKEYNLDKLKEYGLTTIRGPRSMPSKLIKDLNK